MTRNTPNNTATESIAAEPSYEQILVKRQGELSLITLNRPDKLNAWTRQMNYELIDAISAANNDPAIGAIVVTGAGRGFCAGADIEHAFQNREDSERAARERKPDRKPVDWVRFVRESKPIVGAINGVAVGVGITLALPFDVLIASTEAKMGMFFVRMGVVPELASSHFLVQRVGWALASEMCLTGKLYKARELDGTGLVNRVVEPDRLMDDALATARAIAENPESSLRAVKYLLTANGAESDFEKVQEREREALAIAYESPAHKEAIQAFVEKRKPVFR